MGDSNPEVMVGELGAGLVRIDFYPGEVNDAGTWRGHFYVYVRGDRVKTFEACGGPPPDLAHADRGGHTAGPTREGTYILAAPEHHTTDSWPTSTIPWGAAIRARADQDVEFSPDGGRSWIAATGPRGTITRSWVAFEQRTRAGDAAQSNGQHKSDPGFVQKKATPLTPDEITSIGVQARSFFYRNGQLIQRYDKNDFGNWAWNLTQGGSRSDLFVHTTPSDEAAAAAGTSFQLTQSHGCVHIRPADRDEMMTLGYLQKGVMFVVKKYGVQGA